MELFRLHIIVGRDSNYIMTCMSFYMLQGGVHRSLRDISVDFVKSLPFFGIAIGGYSFRPSNIYKLSTAVLIHRILG